MSLPSMHSSKSAPAFTPRPAMDPAARLRTYGPLRPLDWQPSWLDRLLRR